MANKLVYEIKEKDAGKKLIHFLKIDLKMSTRFTRKMAKNNLAKLNGKKAINSDILQKGDILEVTLDTDDSQDVEPEDIKIDIVYEDEDLLVVNKPPFMVVHPTRSHQSGTLANGVAYYFRKTGQDCIVRLVNRLDRDTSGLVIIAKSQFAHQQMANRLDNNNIEKSYIAFVDGFMSGKDTVDLPIGRPTQDSLKREVMKEGQRAITHYEVLAGCSVMSCLRVTLETGRTHQIRVHMSHLGHPIVGDTLYGMESEYIDRQALHAFKLKFPKIRDNSELEITSDMPNDMIELLKHVERTV